MPSTRENPVSPRYVEAALPLPLRRTFTYRLPAGFANKVGIGARLNVPFGPRYLTGYAVELHDELAPELGLEESEIKDVQRLIDEEPLITKEIVELTRWAADYYAASWGEMLKASLPAGINAATEQLLEITAAGKDAIVEQKSRNALKWRVLEYIDRPEETPQRDIEKEFGPAAAKRAIRELVNLDYAGLRTRTVTTKVKPKRLKAVRLIDAEPSEDPNLKPPTEAQNKILETLRENGGKMLFVELAAASGSGASSINTLAKHGRVKVFIEEVLRDPMTLIPDAERRPDIVLNAEQEAVLSQIEKPLAANEFKAFLLHGVTGSGKTEVYIRAMRKTLDQGRSALMLVPEISLTPIFSQRLRAVFGSDVAILHSNLSPGERFDEWRRIRGDKARVVIGTRSAVFAPLRNIGLLIVDEEHDASYRQHDSPFYNARDTAVVRAKNADAVIILGSATPALESYFNAKNGKYTYLAMPKRIGGRPLAKAELIDMREVFRQAGKDVALSPQLIDAIRETFEKGEQTIILLNRRGFSQFVLCRTCGESIKCKNCDITLTYHRRGGRIACHYCGYQESTPEECPKCSSEYLYFIGDGTEKLEDSLAALFPEFRIARVDRDTMSRRGEMAKTLFKFDRGELDMLVGTQMLAKGFDFHNVTLVGVISVDIGLGLPDLRSAERTFQLLTQVAGRAGRGTLPGRVLIQTYYPEHYALKHAVNQDFEGFYSEEIKFRERLNYPPFVALASIMIKHKDESTAFRNARLVRDGLDRANAARICRIVGPAQASIARLKGEYRLQILIRSAKRNELRRVLDIGISNAEAAGCDLRTVFVEIDPVNLM